MIKPKLALAEDAERLLNEPALPPSERLMCWASAAVAVFNTDACSFFFRRCLAFGMSVLRLKEVVLQNYLFCGFPAAIEGLILLKESIRDQGLSDDNYKDPRTSEEVVENGRTLCRTIYKNNYEKLIMHINSLSVDLFDWMIMEGYGKVLSRPVLSPRERELCVVAALSAMARERQLISHLKGAINVGVLPRQLRAVLEGNRLLVDKTLVERSLRCFEGLLQ